MDFTHTYVLQSLTSTRVLDEATGGRYVPRAVLMDLEPGRQFDWKSPGLAGVSSSYLYSKPQDPLLIFRATLLGHADSGVSPNPKP